MLQRGGGRIVNITSIGGKVAVPHLVPYCSAKFATVGFSEGIRAELAKNHIKVTTVVPGLMRTGSHANAVFKGDHHKEYSWFALGATLPFSSMDAHRAARRIVDAAARGTAEIVLTPQAKLLSLAHGIAPGTMSDILGIANRFMPGTGNRDPHRFTGKESETLGLAIVPDRAGTCSRTRSESASRAWTGGWRRQREFAAAGTASGRRRTKRSAGRLKR